MNPGSEQASSEDPFLPFLYDSGSQEMSCNTTDFSTGNSYSPLSVYASVSPEMASQMVDSIMGDHQDSQDQDNQVVSHCQSSKPSPPAAKPVKVSKFPKTHLCTTCKRMFARLEHLNRHERSHTKEKPFVCLTCHRRFSRADLRKRHNKTVHGDRAVVANGRRKGSAATSASSSSAAAAATDQNAFFAAKKGKSGVSAAAAENAIAAGFAANGGVANKRKRKPAHLALKELKKPRADGSSSTGIAGYNPAHEYGNFDFMGQMEQQHQQHQQQQQMAEYSYLAGTVAGPFGGGCAAMTTLPSPATTVSSPAAFNALFPAVPELTPPPMQPMQLPTTSTGTAATYQQQQQQQQLYSRFPATSNSSSLYIAAPNLHHQQMMMGGRQQQHCLPPTPPHSYSSPAPSTSTRPAIGVVTNSNGTAVITTIPSPLTEQMNWSPVNVSFDPSLASATSSSSSFSSASLANSNSQQHQHQHQHRLSSSSATVNPNDLCHHPSGSQQQQQQHDQAARDMQLHNIRLTLPQLAMGLLDGADGASTSASSVHQNTTSSFSINTAEFQHQHQLQQHDQNQHALVLGQQQMQLHHQPNHLAASGGGGLSGDLSSAARAGNEAKQVLEWFDTLVY